MKLWIRLLCLCIALLLPLSACASGEERQERKNAEEWLRGCWALTRVILPNGKEINAMKYYALDNSIDLEISTSTGVMWGDISQGFSWTYEGTRDGRITFSVRASDSHHPEEHVAYLTTSRDPSDTLCYGRLVMECSNEFINQIYGYKIGSLLIFERQQ